MVEVSQPLINAHGLRNRGQENCYLPDFQYTHKNIYHDKLSEFSNFVLRDNESEKLQGKWKADFFQNNHPLHIEVGTGYGNFMRSFCGSHPHINFIGMDYRFKRSYQLAQKLSKLEHRNYALLRARGERLKFMFAHKEIDRIYYFFPDPWPKQKHKKNRLFQAPFLDSLYPLLVDGGELWIKTDHLDYALWMQKLIAEYKDKFEILLNTLELHKEFPEHPIAHMSTKFEKIFLKQKVPIKSFILRKKSYVR